MKCPNCGEEDIRVDVQLSLLVKLSDLLEPLTITPQYIRDSIDFMWCTSCDQGVKLTEDGKLISYMEHIGRDTKAPKGIKDIRGVLASMPKEKLAELLKEINSGSGT